MQRRNKQILQTPVINKIVYLNKMLIHNGHKLPHGRKHKNKDGEIVATIDVRRCYLYPLLEKAGTLFNCAFRQLRGKDYLKRSIEIIEEIQAQSYFITELKGWSNEVAAQIDVLCDEIIEQLYSIEESKKNQSH